MNPLEDETEGVNSALSLASVPLWMPLADWEMGFDSTVFDRTH